MGGYILDKYGGPPNGGYTGAYVIIIFLIYLFNKLNIIVILIFFYYLGFGYL